MHIYVFIIGYISTHTYTQTERKEKKKGEKEEKTEHAQQAQKQDKYLQETKIQQ